MRHPDTPQKAAIYLRVSTSDQDAQNQVPELVAICRRRGFDIVGTYDETVSGVAQHRPELARMMADAARGRFDVLLVWALDRLGRLTYDVVERVRELDRLGIHIISAREQWIDAPPGPVRDLLVYVMAWVAGMERTRLRERTAAGHARARAKGTKIGRRVNAFDFTRAATLRAEGKSLRAISRAVKVPLSTLRRAFERAERRALADDRERQEMQVREG